MIVSERDSMCVFLYLQEKFDKLHSKNPIKLSKSVKNLNKFNEYQKTFYQNLKNKNQEQ
jgi:hypothetical protein